MYIICTLKAAPICYIMLENTSFLIFIVELMKMLLKAFILLMKIFLIKPDFTSVTCVIHWLLSIINGHDTVSLIYHLFYYLKKM